MTDPMIVILFYNKGAKMQQQQEQFYTGQFTHSLKSLRTLVIYTWLSYGVAILLAWVTWGSEGSRPLEHLLGSWIDPFLSFVPLPVGVFIFLGLCQVFLFTSMKKNALNTSDQYNLLLGHRLVNLFLFIMVVYLLFFRALQLPGPSTSFGYFATLYTTLTLYLTFPTTIVAWNAHKNIQ